MMILQLESSTETIKASLLYLPSSSHSENKRGSSSRRIFGVGMHNGSFCDRCMLVGRALHASQRASQDIGLLCFSCNRGALGPLRATCNLDSKRSEKSTESTAFRSAEPLRR